MFVNHSNLNGINAVNMNVALRECDYYIIFAEESIDIKSDRTLNKTFVHDSSYFYPEMNSEREAGITFAVYGNKKGAEKIFPFNIIPRIVDSDDWEIIESGLKQRIEALNLFIDDIYHDQKF